MKQEIEWARYIPNFDHETGNRVSRYIPNFDHETGNRKLNCQKTALRHLLKSKKKWNCKVLYTWPDNNHQHQVYSRRTRDQPFCSLVFLDVLPKNTNKMSGKRFNLFDECATRLARLSSQEEGCTSSHWRDSKIYTSGSIENSQTILNEINESGAVAKVRVYWKVILSSNDSIRIISSARDNFTYLMLMIF